MTVDIAHSLLGYTNRLRASAMYPDSNQSTKTAVSATSSQRITYCQAVLWIEPLLTLIDQGNNQLESIKKIEAGRLK